MYLLVLLVCFLASMMGSMAGFGGGVIIKPALDAMDLMPVSIISFLSGITVLSMAAVSLLRSRGGEISLQTSLPLALGAAAGGILGRFLFSALLSQVQNEALAGSVQAALLLAATVAACIYLHRKNRLRTYHIGGSLPCLVVGLCLGGISAFLGIGGGPYNMAILYWLFSMEGKQAAKNSLFIILFSQSASLCSTLIAGSIPDFSWPVLVLMASGGIGGALAGGRFSRNLTAKGIDKLLLFVLALILFINGINLIRFIMQL